MDERYTFHGIMQATNGGWFVDFPDTPDGSYSPRNSRAEAKRQAKYDLAQNMHEHLRDNGFFPRPSRREEIEARFPGAEIVRLTLDPYDHPPDFWDDDEDHGSSGTPGCPVSLASREREIDEIRNDEHEGLITQDEAEEIWARRHASGGVDPGDRHLWEDDEPEDHE